MYKREGGGGKPDNTILRYPEPGDGDYLPQRDNELVSLQRE